MNKYQNVKISMAALFFTHVGGPVYRTAVLLVKSIDVGPSGEQESHHLKVAKKPKKNKQGMRKNIRGRCNINLPIYHLQ